MGSTFVRKWGRRPDYKKEETEVEICGALLEEESFLCHVLPKAGGLILAYGTSNAAPLGKNTPENIYTCLIIQLGLPK